MAGPIVTVIPTVLPGPTKPDWPPRDSAWRLEEGTRKYGSTGQLFEVKQGRWVRVDESQSG